MRMRMHRPDFVAEAGRQAVGRVRWQCLDRWNILRGPTASFLRTARHIPAGKKPLLLPDVRDERGTY